MIILHAEDNDSDATLLEVALDEAGFEGSFHRVNNGEECLRFLRREKNFEMAPSPNLVILDINMPIKDGHEVMEEIMQDIALRNQPVMVLSTSSAADDINRMYQNRCNSYVVKPNNYKEFQTLIKLIIDHWNAVKFPRAL